MGRTPASDPISDALDATMPASSAQGLRLDALTPEQQSSVIRARERGLGFKTISTTLSKNGFPCGPGAVENWLKVNGHA
jgi:hypothetical protein